MSRGRAPSRATDDQGFTEILIVIALIAITAIGVASLFGEQIEELFSGKPPEAQSTSQARPQSNAAPGAQKAPGNTTTTQTPPVAPAK